MKKYFNLVKVAQFVAIAMFSLSCYGNMCPTCGGGGGGTTIKQVSGTAATGMAVAGTVYIKDANGRVVSGVLNSDGTYTVDVSALTPPFIVYIEGTVAGKTVKLYSMTNSSERVNVTPATNLVMALALGDDPANVYSPEDIKQDGKVLAAAPANDKLTAAQQTVEDVLQNVYAALGVADNFDIMNGTFAADGTGFDKLLDVVRMAVDTSTGSAVVRISDAITASVFYEENASDGSVITDNTESMATVTATASADLDQINQLYKDYLQYIKDTASDEATFRANLEKVLASDYLGKCRNKTEEIEEFVNSRGDFMSNTYSIKNIVIGEQIHPYSFEAATLTTTVDYPPFLEYPAFPADTYTFIAKTIGMSTGTANFKVIKVYYVEEYINKDGVLVSNCCLDFVVQNVEGGDWKIWGTRSVARDFRTSMTKTVYPEWDGTSWITQETIQSGYNVHCDDHENYMSSKFGVNAILILGQGITAEYAPGKKGILLLKIDDEFRPVNVPSMDNSNGHYIYDENAGLDITSINNSELMMIGMFYNSVEKTFTPKRRWVSNPGHIPLSVTNGSLTGDNFGTFSLSGTNLADYTGCIEVPWALPWSHTVTWIPPVKTNMVFSNFSYYFEGNIESTANPGTADETISTWIENDIENTQIPDGSYPITINNSDTDIFKLNCIKYEVRYDDMNGTGFRINYLIRRR